MTQRQVVIEEAEDEKDPVQTSLQRIETLLDQQQAGLPSEYARLGLGLGVAMVLGACVLMLVGAPFDFSITCLVWGSIIAAFSLWLRSRAQSAQVEQTRVLGDLHARVARLSQRQRFLERLWSDGLPTSCSIADVLLLLEAQISNEQGARS